MLGRALKTRRLLCKLLDCMPGTASEKATRLDHAIRKAAADMAHVAPPQRAHTHSGEHVALPADEDARATAAAGVASAIEAAPSIAMDAHATAVALDSEREQRQQQRSLVVATTTAVVVSTPRETAIREAASEKAAQLEKAFRLAASDFGHPDVSRALVQMAYSA